MMRAWLQTVAERMARAARAGRGRAGLGVEPLELRDTPAGLMASVSGGVVSGLDQATGAARFQVTPYPGFTGGINVAVGDVNGDGTADLITGARAGGGPVVNVYDGTDGHLLDSFTAGDAASRVGVGVAAADYDGDGRAEIVVGASRGGRPLVQVLRFPDHAVVKTYTPAFNADVGANVAAGDLNGDGTPDTVIGAGAGAGPRVLALDGRTDATLLDTFAFEPTFTGGVGVAAGDVNGDGRADVVCSAGVGGGPRIHVFSGLSGGSVLDFFAYDSGRRNGVSAYLADTNGDGRPELVTADGTGQPTDPRAFDTRTQTQVAAPSGLAAAPADTTAPGLTLTSAAAAVGRTTPLPFTATFSEPVTGFAAADLQVANGTVANFTAADARTYTFTVTPTADGAVTVTAPAGAAADAAGNPSRLATLTRTYDTTAPTATVTSSAPASTGTSPIPFTVTFSEDVTGFVAADLQVTNGTVANFTATSARTYTFNVVPTAGGAVTVAVPAGAAADAAGNASTAAPALSRTFVTGAVAVTANAVSTNRTTPTLTGTVGSATAAVRVQVGGQTVAATVSGTTWTATLPTALAAGTYDVTVIATLPNNAGSGVTTLTGGLVIDATAPTATISSSAPEPTSTAPVPFTVTFSEDVTGFTASDLQVANGTVTNFAAASGRVYTFSVVPTAPGAVTVSVATNAAIDAAGNGNTAGATATRTFGTGAVALTVNRLATNDTTPTLTGSVGTSTATVSVQVGGQTVAATVSGTTWTATLPTALAAGTYDVVVTAALPSNGGTGSLTLTGGLVIDTTAPTATVTSTAADHTNLAAIPFTVTFSEDVTGFTSGDLTVTNGTVFGFTQVDAHTYTFTVTPTANGAVTASVAADAATDAAGNGNTAAAPVIRTSDRAAPTVVLSSTAPDLTNTSPIPFTATFSEDVTGFTASDLTVINGTVIGFTPVDARTYTFTIAPATSGPITVSVAAGVATDLAGNTNLAVPAITRVFGTGAVGLMAARLATNSTTPTLTGTVASGTATVSVQVGGQTITATVTGTTWTATVPTALAAGTYDVVITATLPSNGGTGSLTATGGLVIDTTAPTATVGSTATEPTSATAIAFTVTFSEDVTGFTSGDLTVTNGTVGGFTQVDAHTYTFTVAPVTGGAVTVSVAAGAAADLAGNASAAVAALTRTFNPPANPTPTSVARDTSVLATTAPPANSPNFVPVPNGNGLKIWDMVQGSGPAVAAGNVVTVDYTGWLAFNGAQFDTSRTGTQAATFDLDNLIQGWKLGIPGMRPGGIRRLYVPAALGYGAQGFGTSIPPNTDLIFEIRLLSSTP